MMLKTQWLMVHRTIVGGFLLTLVFMGFGDLSSVYGETPTPEEIVAASTKLNIDIHTKEFSETFKKYNHASYLFVGELVDYEYSKNVKKSRTPAYRAELTFKVMMLYRGNLKQGQTVKCRVINRDRREYPKGKRCVVVLDRTFFSGTDFNVADITECDPEDKVIQAAIIASSYPIGWAIEDGKVYSPWSVLGKAAWPKGQASIDSNASCLKTGRPSLFCGHGMKLTAKPVMPKKLKKYTNPDGNGLYQITLTNTTDKPIIVQALLNDGEADDWHNSLLILCEGKVYHPRATPLADATASLTQGVFQPGESRSVMVNIFELNGPTWPPGGNHVQLLFAIGELSVGRAFYYYGEHHDPIRKRVWTAYQATLNQKH